MQMRSREISWLCARARARFDKAHPLGAARLRRSELAGHRHLWCSRDKIRGTRAVGKTFWSLVQGKFALLRVPGAGSNGRGKLIKTPARVCAERKKPPRVSVVRELLISPRGEFGRGSSKRMLPDYFEEEFSLRVSPMPNELGHAM